MSTTVKYDHEAIMRMGKMMAASDFMVPVEFRDNPGACTGIAFLADRLGMDPYQVVSKAFVQTDTDGVSHVAYQAQFFTAVINARAPVDRITYRYKGEGEDRYCTATCKTTDEPSKTLRYVSPTIRLIPYKKSAMWEDDPDQQLAYFSGRNLARRYFPDILMGMYTPEEVQSMGDGRAAPHRETLSERLNRGDAKSSIPDQLAEAESIESINKIMEDNQHLIDAMDTQQKLEIASALNSRTKEIQDEHQTQPDT